MTLGRLASISLEAGTNTLIYTVSERQGNFTATVNIANRNKTDVEIRLAFVNGVLADLVAADWIEYDVIVRAGGLIERSEIKLTPGQSIIGYSDSNNVNFSVWA